MTIGKANFPTRFQFVHEDATYDAILLDGEDSPAATGVCCLCEKSLRGRPYYVTVPFLFHMHADCAVAEFTSAGYDDERSRGLHHGEGSGSRHYYHYPPPSGPYGLCPAPPPPLQQNYSYSSPADHYSGQYYYYPPHSGPYGWCPPPLQNQNYSYSYSYSNPYEHHQYSQPYYCYPPPPSTQYNNSTTQPQAHQITKPSVTGIIIKLAIASCLKALFVAMFL